MVKAEFLFGNKQPEKGLVESYGLLSSNMQCYVKNLGVIFDSDLHFDCHIS